MGYLVPDLNSWPSEGAQLGRAAAICSKRLLASVALRGRLVSPRGRVAAFRRGQAGVGRAQTLADHGLRLNGHRALCRRVSAGLVAD